MNPVRYTYRYRSFFWPAVLILVGIVALLVNTGRLPVDRLYLLFNLWPLILIVIGVELVIRRSLQGSAGDAVAAGVIIVAIVGAAGYVALAPNSVVAHTLDASDTTGNLDHASLEIDVGGATITVSGNKNLGGELYRAHIEYSGQKPEVSLDRSSGSLRISQESTSFLFLRGDRLVLDLQLSAAVPWTITENSGAATDTLNLAGLHVGSVAVNTGASREEITLGEPSGIVPVEVNGGALTVNVHRPSGVAVSVDVSGGTVSLTADGRHQGGIGSLSYASSGFSGASDAYRISINGGATTVTLDTTGD